ILIPVSWDAGAAEAGGDLIAKRQIVMTGDYISAAVRSDSNAAQRVAGQVLCTRCAERLTDVLRRQPASHVVNVHRRNRILCLADATAVSVITISGIERAVADVVYGLTVLGIVFKCPAGDIDVQVARWVVCVIRQSIGVDIKRGRGGGSIDRRRTIIG